MNDQATQNSNSPAPPETTRTFFTVEIVHGGSPELNNLACIIVQLGVESTIAAARIQMLNRKHQPQIILHTPGTVQT